MHYATKKCYEDAPVLPDDRRGYAGTPHNLINDKNGCIAHARVHAPSAMVREVRRRMGDKGWIDNRKLNAVIIDVAPYEMDTPPRNAKKREKEVYIKKQRAAARSLLQISEEEEKLMSALILIMEAYRYRLMHGKPLLVQPFTPHWDDVIASSVLINKTVRRLHAAWRSVNSFSHDDGHILKPNRTDCLTHKHSISLAASA